MFSGIIQTVGKITNREKESDGLRLAIGSSLIAKKVKPGSSVAVNGVCLTVEKKIGSTVLFRVMKETLKKTTLGMKQAGEAVNLESALRIGDELGGHFVYGHVDGVASVTEIKPDGDGALLTIALPTALMKYVAPQGAITIDGVSLTIASRKKNTVTVSLVDYTVAHTTLGALKKGDKVNVETDMIGKYAGKLETQKSKIKTIT